MLAVAGDSGLIEFYIIKDEAKSTFSISKITGMDVIS
jgi:hypothetical protein